VTQRNIQWHEASRGLSATAELPVDIYVRRYKMQQEAFVGRSVGCAAFDQQLAVAAVRRVIIAVFLSVSTAAVSAAATN